MLVSDNYLPGIGVRTCGSIDSPDPTRTTQVNVRTLATAGIVGLGAVALGAALWNATALAPEGHLLVAGDVRTTVYVVRAPAVTAPAPDYTVGLPASSSAKPATRKPSSQGGTARSVAVSGMLRDMLVAEGDHVTKGQKLASLDATMLDLGVEQARTAAARAHANVEVMGANLDTLADNRSTLASTRAKLISTLVTLRSGRADLAAQLAALQALVGRTGAASASASTAASTTPTGPPDPAALIAKLKAAIARMDAGIVELEAGIAKLDRGAATLSSARAQLVDARDLMEILADGQDVGVRVAQARRDAATIVSPIDGTVLFAHASGVTVMVGVPLVRIRPDGPALVDTYLTPEQLAGVRPGSAATVDWDSNAAGPVPASVTIIGDISQYPPTGFPTSVVHMTQTVRVTVSLHSDSGPPAGTPVDIDLQTD